VLRGRGQQLTLCGQVLDVLADLHGQSLALPGHCMRGIFGSMINMDDLRHARLRRIVSRSFTPKMIQKLEDDVQERPRTW
jgi:cytochrome P450